MAPRSPPVFAADENPLPPRRKQWSFDGVFGTYDRAAAQRGFQVYKQVCSACHPVEHLRFGDLAGLGYTPSEIKAIAASDQVTDGPNDQGQHGPAAWACLRTRSPARFRTIRRRGRQTVARFLPTCR